MAVYPIGEQRVGIRTDTAVLDADGNPTYTEYGQPVTAPRTRWVDGACFEIQTPTEQQNLTVTTSEIGWALLPVTGDNTVPVDDGTALPVTDITSAAQLVHNDRVYQMRGDAVLEQDLHGRPDHVFCVCEREQG